ncbi:DUF2752 domain-containing protein [Mucilaginibacter limnophilus]|uniref:DUF2752 domain-containing protein n=1 Tax=Mucilaginibacter limnophilus TaxID=1932778 RepID=A0A437MWX0_9SPHI|nr:DUF2752 domain-containing protein [Mucilaginibacter limnophilus]
MQAWQQLTGWLQSHLLPCPFKYITGIDCPGCGFQRSVVALLNGQLSRSFELYPPALPLLLVLIYLFADKKFKLDTPNHVVKKTIYMAVGSFILVVYSLKMWHLYIHPHTTA